MRQAFVTTLLELARNKKNIFLLTGDLGFSVFENFRKEFPDRFFNMGVAEQNMIGVAAGLSLSGKIVFVYSIAPFVTMRCFEQIRNDLCMQNLNVKIIGMGAGFHYGVSGPTHHAVEDISIMRSLPNMIVISPATVEDTICALKSAVSHNGPVYIRLSKSYTFIKYHFQKGFCIGKGILVRQGRDITIIVAGSILSNTLEVIKELEKSGITARLINMHTIKPIDKNIILKAAKETKAIFTIEEHIRFGGLGSAVSEVLAESSYKILFKRFALSDSYSKIIGTQEYLLDRDGLSVKQIAKSICRIWKNAD